MFSTFYILFSGFAITVLCNNEEILETSANIQYSTPKIQSSAYLCECFDSDLDKWIVSAARKDGVEADLSKYEGVWEIGSMLQDSLVGDRGLVLKSKAKHSAISRQLSRPFHFTDKPLVFQYEVNFQDGQECGGAYVKLLSHSNHMNLTEFNDKTPYTIMFGPDKCGNDRKIHFIIRHLNPKTMKFEEKHAYQTAKSLESIFTDKNIHQFRLVLRPDNTFEIFVDNSVVKSGSLLQDMTPPVNPPKEIDDPNDSKPSDWDERPKIPDTEAVKPDDWDEDAPAKIVDEAAEMPADWLEDEPKMIPDPNAAVPDDWDESIDGEWEAPLIDNAKCVGVSGCGKWVAPSIDNPAYKGKWVRPLIDNPAYKGKWSPRKIPNPEYFEDNNPFQLTSIGAVGIEIWSMSDMIYFDNVLLTDSHSDASAFSDSTFYLKEQQRLSKQPSMLTRFMQYTSDRPWLFAVYIVVIALPILILFTIFCTKSKKTDAVKKKTDEMTPNTIEEIEEEESVSHDDSGKVIEQLDAEDDDIEELQQVDTPEPVNGERNDTEILHTDAAGEIPSSDQEDIHQMGDTETVSKTVIRSSPRKRRSYA